MTTAVAWMAPVCALIGICMAGYLGSWVLKQDPGPDKMNKVEYTADTMPLMQGIWRIWLRVTGSSGPYHRKVSFMAKLLWFGKLGRQAARPPSWTLRIFLQKARFCRFDGKMEDKVLKGLLQRLLYQNKQEIFCRFHGVFGRFYKKPRQMG